MNYTELFRDFLIKNHAKEKYVKAFTENRYYGAFRHRYTLSWKNDFLTEIMKKEHMSNNPKCFLSNGRFISLGGTDNECIFWERLYYKWSAFLSYSRSVGLTP